MTKDEAEKGAAAILALINSQPRTPSKEQMVLALLSVDRWVEVKLGVHRLRGEPPTESLDDLAAAIDRAAKVCADAKALSSRPLTKWRKA